MVKSALVRAEWRTPGLLRRSLRLRAEPEPAPVRLRRSRRYRRLRCRSRSSRRIWARSWMKCQRAAANVKIEAGESSQWRLAACWELPDAASEEEAPELAPAPVGIADGAGLAFGKVEEEEEEEEPSGKGSWRRDGGGEKSRVL